MIKLRSLVSYFLMLLFVVVGGQTGCDSGVVTEAPQASAGAVNIKAFTLSASFPADIDIVRQPDLSSVAFITQTTAPYVIAIDLNSNPLAISTVFKGLPELPAQQNIGIPSSLFVLDAQRAFLLTSSALVYFNPKTGSIYETLSLIGAIVQPTQAVSQVNGKGESLSPISQNLELTLPASVVATNDQILVSFSNLHYGPDFSVSSASQGIVQSYALRTSAPFLVPQESVATSGYNASGLTLLNNGTFLINSTGLTELKNGASSPLTDGFVDCIDLKTKKTLASINLGKTAPAFRSWAVSADEKRAYLGSSTGGYVLEILLDPFILVRGASNPIVVTSAENGSDFLQDVLVSPSGKSLFVFSYNQSKIYELSLVDSTNPTLVGTPIDLSLPGNLGITGAGPAAFRFDNTSSANLFVLTGNPGTVASVEVK